uniref:Gastrokine 1 n=1 Tax=Salvator merianae TaxID=96440 RepID=A0A8D0CB02_SALMN
MKLLILSTALLGVFLAPILADNSISEQNKGNVGGDSHQTVSIDRQSQTVNVDNNNGWHSWNTIFDYGKGYIATRHFASKKCIISKIDPHIMPDVTTLPQVIKEKQKNHAREPPSKQITYMVSHKRITNLAPYGKGIEAMCKGIPAYAAYEVRRPSFYYYSGSCFNAGILWIVGINYCGETVEA